LAIFPVGGRTTNSAGVADLAELGASLGAKWVVAETMTGPTESDSSRTEGEEFRGAALTHKVGPVPEVRRGLSRLDRNLDAARDPAAVAVDLPARTVAGITDLSQDPRSRRVARV